MIGYQNEGMINLTKWVHNMKLNHQDMELKSLILLPGYLIVGFGDIGNCITIMGDSIIDSDDLFLYIELSTGTKVDVSGKVLRVIEDGSIEVCEYTAKN